MKDSVHHVYTGLMNRFYLGGDAFWQKVSCRVKITNDVQFFLIERAQHGLAIALRNFIGLGLCAFLHLEYRRLQTGT